MLAIPAPLPARIVPVAGISPATLLARGEVDTPTPRNGISMGMGWNDQPVRTDAVESVSTDGLHSTVAQVAEELAARLDQALHSQRR
ncbi:MAG TPA: hypothetical protein VMI73_03295 [Trebonia sp.]|nr:hypothetical protein [Trebonia sp.]